MFLQPFDRGTKALNSAHAAYERRLGKTKRDSSELVTSNNMIKSFRVVPFKSSRVVPFKSSREFTKR